MHFPERAVNQIVESRAQEKNYERHINNIQTARPCIDISHPNVALHIEKAQKLKKKTREIVQNKRDKIYAKIPKSVEQQNMIANKFSNGSKNGFTDDSYLMQSYSLTLEEDHAITTRKNWIEEIKNATYCNQNKKINDTGYSPQKNQSGSISDNKYRYRYFNNNCVYCFVAKNDIEEEEREKKEFELKYPDPEPTSSDIFFSDYSSSQNKEEIDIESKKEFDSEDAVIKELVNQRFERIKSMNSSRSRTSESNNANNKNINQNDSDNYKERKKIDQKYMKFNSHYRHEKKSPIKSVSINHNLQNNQEETNSKASNEFVFQNDDFYKFTSPPIISVPINQKNKASSPQNNSNAAIIEEEEEDLGDDHFQLPKLNFSNSNQFTNGKRKIADENNLTQINRKDDFSPKNSNKKISSQPDSENNTFSTPKNLKQSPLKQNNNSDDLSPVLSPSTNQNLNENDKSEQLTLPSLNINTPIKPPQLVNDSTQTPPLLSSSSLSPQTPIVIGSPMNLEQLKKYPEFLSTESDSTPQHEITQTPQLTQQNSNLNFDSCNMSSQASFDAFSPMSQNISILTSTNFTTHQDNKNDDDKNSSNNNTIQMNKNNSPTDEKIADSVLSKEGLTINDNQKNLNSQPTTNSSNDQQNEKLIDLYDKQDKNSNDNELTKTDNNQQNENSENNKPKEDIINSNKNQLKESSINSNDDLFFSDESQQNIISNKSKENQPNSSENKPNEDPMNSVDNQPNSNEDSFVPKENPPKENISTNILINSSNPTSIADQKQKDPTNNAKGSLDRDNSSFFDGSSSRLFSSSSSPRQQERPDSRQNKPKTPQDQLQQQDTNQQESLSPPHISQQNGTFKDQQQQNSPSQQQNSPSQQQKEEKIQNQNPQDQPQNLDKIQNKQQENENKKENDENQLSVVFENSASPIKQKRRHHHSHHHHHIHRNEPINSPKTPNSQSSRASLAKYEVEAIQRLPTGELYSKTDRIEKPIKTLDENGDPLPKDQTLLVRPHSPKRHISVPDHLPRSRKSRSKPEEISLFENDVGYEVPDGFVEIKDEERESYIAKRITKKRKRFKKKKGVPPVLDYKEFIVNDFDYKIYMKGENTKGKNDDELQNEAINDFNELKKTRKRNAFFISDILSFDNKEVDPKVLEEEMKRENQSDSSYDEQKNQEEEENKNEKEEFIKEKGPKYQPFNHTQPISHSKPVSNVNDNDQIGQIIQNHVDALINVISEHSATEATSNNESKQAPLKKGKKKSRKAKKQAQKEDEIKQDKESNDELENMDESRNNQIIENDKGDSVQIEEESKEKKSENEWSCFTSSNKNNDIISKPQESNQTENQPEEKEEEEEDNSSNKNDDYWSFTDSQDPKRSQKNNKNNDSNDANISENESNKKKSLNNEAFEEEEDEANSIENVQVEVLSNEIESNKSLDNQENDQKGELSENESNTDDQLNSQKKSDISNSQNSSQINSDGNAKDINNSDENGTVNSNDKNNEEESNAVDDSIKSATNEESLFEEEEEDNNEIVFEKKSAGYTSNVSYEASINENKTEYSANNENIDSKSNKSEASSEINNVDIEKSDAKSKNEKDIEKSDSLNSNEDKEKSDAKSNNDIKSDALRDSANNEKSNSERSNDVSSHKSDALSDSANDKKSNTERSNDVSSHKSDALSDSANDKKSNTERSNDVSSHKSDALSDSANDKKSNTERSNDVSSHKSDALSDSANGKKSNSERSNNVSSHKSDALSDSANGKKSNTERSNDVSSHKSDALSDSANCKKSNSEMINHEEGKEKSNNGDDNNASDYSKDAGSLNEPNSARSNASLQSNESSISTHNSKISQNSLNNESKSISSEKNSKKSRSKSRHSSSIRSHHSASSIRSKSDNKARNHQKVDKNDSGIENAGKNKEGQPSIIFSQIATSLLNDSKTTVSNELPTEMTISFEVIDNGIIENKTNSSEAKRNQVKKMPIENNNKEEEEGQIENENDNQKEAENSQIESENQKETENDKIENESENHKETENGQKSANLNDHDTAIEEEEEEDNYYESFYDNSSEPATQSGNLESVSEIMDKSRVGLNENNKDEIVLSTEEYFKSQIHGEDEKASSEFTKEDSFHFQSQASKSNDLKEYGDLLNRNKHILKQNKRRRRQKAKDNPFLNMPYRILSQSPSSPLSTNVHSTQQTENNNEEVVKRRRRKTKHKKVQPNQENSELIESICTSQIDSEKVESNQIDSEKVKSSQINSEKVESKQIDSENVESNQIDSEKVKSSQINSEKVESSQINSKKVESSQIDSEKVKSDEIDSEKVESDEIISEKVESSQIDSEKVESDKVDSEKVKFNQIDSAKIDSDKSKGNSKRRKSSRFDPNHKKLNKDESDKIKSNETDSEKVKSVHNQEEEKPTENQLTFTSNIIAVSLLPATSSGHSSGPEKKSQKPAQKPKQLVQSVPLHIDSKVVKSTSKEKEEPSEVPPDSKVVPLIPLDEDDILPIDDDIYTAANKRQHFFEMQKNSNEAVSIPPTPVKDAQVEEEEEAKSLTSTEINHYEQTETSEAPEDQQAPMTTQKVSSIKDRNKSPRKKTKSANKPLKVVNESDGIQVIGDSPLRQKNGGKLEKIAEQFLKAKVVSPSKMSVNDNVADFDISLAPTEHRNEMSKKIYYRDLLNDEITPIANFPALAQMSHMNRVIRESTPRKVFKADQQTPVPNSSLASPTPSRNRNRKTENRGRKSPGQTTVVRWIP